MYTPKAKSHVFICMFFLNANMCRIYNLLQQVIFIQRNNECLYKQAICKFYSSSHLPNRLMSHWSLYYAQLFCRCAYKSQHIVVHVKRSQPKPFCNGIITHKIIIQTSDTFVLYVYTVYLSSFYMYTQFIQVICTIPFFCNLMNAHLLAYNRAEREIT